MDYLAVELFIVGTEGEDYQLEDNHLVFDAYNVWTFCDIHS